MVYFITFRQFTDSKFAGYFFFYQNLTNISFITYLTKQVGKVNGYNLKKNNLPQPRTISMCSTISNIHIIIFTAKEACFNRTGFFFKVIATLVP